MKCIILSTRYCSTNIRTVALVIAPVIAITIAACLRHIIAVVAELAL